MRISWSDANIVLAKDIWYCIDSLTNRDFVKETFLMTMNKGVSVRINRINLNREKKNDRGALGFLSIIYGGCRLFTRLLDYNDTSLSECRSVS